MARIPESHRDLLAADVAVLTTVSGDGSPHTTPVWFLADGDTVELSLNTKRRKTKNLVANPACGLLILDLSNPYRYLELRGEADITPDPEYVFADKVGAKYGANLREMDPPGDSRVIVTLRVRKVNAADLSR